MWGSAVQVCSGLPLKRWKSEKVKKWKGKKVKRQFLKPSTFQLLNFWTFQLYSGGLAQLARAPALQAGGQRFESVILHFRTRKSRCDNYELWIENYELSEAIFDILVAKAKCKANLRVIYWKMYDVVKKRKSWKYNQPNLRSESGYWWECRMKV